MGTTRQQHSTFRPGFRTLRLLLVAVVLLGLCAGAFAADADTTTTPKQTTVPAAGKPAPARTCCKICHKGKACGDSCISREKSCGKPPGCACNG